ncbi:MAG: recombination mediator RecR [Patescibacteria group bacterium]|jgi:recombination protein RecR
MRYPAAIQNLIDQFSQLPSVGPKTAERYVFHLLKSNPDKIQLFARYLFDLKKNLKVCSKCLAISENDPCLICADQNRPDNILCIVASLQDMISLENTRQYQGKYFILGGLINTIENITPNDLPLKKLADKVNLLLKTHSNLEIIIALSPNLEGETTALYLSKILKNPHIKITRLAQGLPSGANLEYVDEITLKNALKYRNII